MIHKVIDRVHSVVSANFDADFNALRGTVPAVNFLADNFFKRLAYEAFSLKVPAGIGIYHEGGASTRRRPGAGSGAALRETRVNVVLDWYIQGDQPDDVAAQTEIAIQALLRSIDDLPDGTNIVRAAEAEEAITWTVERTTLSDEGRIATERALIRFPCWHRETGL